MIQKKQISVEVLTADSPWFGVTYKEDKPFVTEQIQKLTDLGVYPNTLW
jgi:hypothetical protein